MLIALLAAQAHALSCMYGPYDANVTDQTVPPDVEILVNHVLAPEEATFHLVDEEGNVTPLAADLALAHALLTPEAPLVEGRTYTLAWGTNGEIAGSFTVGPAIDDEEPPAVPEILEVGRERDRSEWGTTEGVRVVLEPATEAGVYFEYEIASSPDFADARSFASVWPESFLGDGLCVDTVEAYDHGVDKFVRVRAVDLSGNASAWSEGVEAAAAFPPFGCSTLSGVAGGWLAVPLLLAMRRRRQGEK